MSGQKPRSSLFLAPVLAWLGLLVALAATLGYAFLPGAPAKIWVGLAIAGTKAGLIALIFMRLTRSTSLVRLTALVGVVWLSLLFILAYCDYLTRLPIER